MSKKILEKTDAYAEIHSLRPGNAVPETELDSFTIFSR